MEKEKKQREKDNQLKHETNTHAKKKETVQLTDRKRKDDKAIKTSLGGF
ncbi:MAG TPA: hypothetical protein VK029_08735 [Pseudogracilibacillus sp.]|nr:hypothetical protein [Pseudogracilibacillus sp.]